MRTQLVGVRVTDQDRSRALYQALGYTVVGTVPDTPFGTLTMLQLPDDPFVTIELAHDPARPVTETGGLNHLAIKTECAEVSGHPDRSRDPRDASADGEHGS